MNCLTFCLSEKVLISPLLLKGNFTECRILDWWDSLSPLEIFFSTLFLRAWFLTRSPSNSYSYSSLGSDVLFPY